MRKSEIKIGIVGLDSSHAPKYTELLHDKSHSNHVPGGRVVAAYAGGSDDWDLSYSRLPGFRDQMAKTYEVPILGSIEALADAADAIMILSVDGRKHRSQFEAVAAAGKPVYIDKPLAASLADARAIAELATRTGTRVFSSSVWRFGAGVSAARPAVISGHTRVNLSGMWPLHGGLHGWAFYGVHHIELLYALMGPGCQSVSCQLNGSKETIVGSWPDDRIGTITTDHAHEDPFAGTLTGSHGNEVAIDLSDKISKLYAAFLENAVAFFNGQHPPVKIEETLETIAFLETAWRSRSSSGEVLKLP